MIIKNENQDVDQNNDQTNVFEASNEKDENQDPISKNNDTDPQGANENQSSML